MAFEMFVKLTNAQFLNPGSHQQEEFVTGIDRNLLLLEEVDKFDLAKFAKVLLELLLAKGFEVFDVSNVDIPGRTRVHGQCQCGGKRTRVLAPTDLETTVVQGQPLVRSNLEEGQCGSRINECNELHKGAGECYGTPGGG